MVNGVVEEKVMELIRANEVFGFLGDLTVFIRRKELGGNGRCRDIAEGGSHVTRLGFGKGGVPFHEIANEGFWHTYIDVIHGHVISVVSAPTESRFREVASADNEGGVFICKVHEDLSSLTGLGIFVSGV